MRGQHGEIASKCEEVVQPVEDQEMIGVLLREVLRSQYVSPAELPGRIWKVRRGSGMGILCSGEISDAAFAKLAETGYVDSEQVRRRHGLVFYYRFKDDGLFGVSDELAE